MFYACRYDIRILLKCQLTSWKGTVSRDFKHNFLQWSASPRWLIGVFINVKCDVVKNYTFGRNLWYFKTERWCNIRKYIASKMFVLKMLHFFAVLASAVLGEGLHGGGHRGGQQRTGGRAAGGRRYPR
jgi:hypothetical protein